MKPGDLVKLRPGGDGPRLNAVHPIIVAWTGPDEEMALGEMPLEQRFAPGTPAIFLEARSYEMWHSKIAWVLIGGRRGWVFEKELELP